MPKGVYIRTKEHREIINKIRKGGHSYKIGVFIGEKAFAFKDRTIEKKCNKCGNLFKSFVSHKSKFCSHKCFTDFRRVNEIELRGICKKCGGVFSKRKPNGNVNRKKVFCSLLCGVRYNGKIKKTSIRTVEWNKHISEAQKGEKAWNWQGGKTKKSKLLRSSAKFREWRKKVFEQDNYTCWICNARKRTNLHPHHLKELCNYPELVFDVNNGLTLCEFCHKTYTDYGVKKSHSHKNKSYQKFLA